MVFNFLLYELVDIKSFADNRPELLTVSYLRSVLGVLGGGAFTLPDKIWWHIYAKTTAAIFDDIDLHTKCDSDTVWFLKGDSLVDNVRILRNSVHDRPLYKFPPISA